MLWPVEELPVTIHDEPPYYVPLKSNGTFAPNGVTPGKYIVGVGTFDSTHEYQWFSRQSRSTKAKVVTVKSGDTLRGISFSLAHGAQLRGVVKNALGNPVDGAQVEVYDRDGEKAGFDFADHVGSNGSYTIHGLPAGQYRIKISASGFPTQWFAGTDAGGAQLVKLDRRQKKSVNLTLRADPGIASTGRPTISGTTKVGRTLTASKGSWASTPTTYTYQWVRNGSPNKGATSKTYKLRSADHGAKIQVRVGAKVDANTVTTTRISTSSSKIRK